MCKDMAIAGAFGMNVMSIEEEKDASAKRIPYYLDKFLRLWLLRERF